MVHDMIYLYDASEIHFVNAGLGSLTNDTKSCTVLEEKNGQFELTLVYSIDGELFNQIQIDNIILVKPNPYDNPQPFRIYYISFAMDGWITVSARHVSYDLDSYVIKPFSVTNNPVDILGELAHQIMQNPWTRQRVPFGFQVDHSFNVVGEEPTYETKEPHFARSFLGGSDYSILENYGGELQYDRWTIYFKKNRGEDRGVLIRYGLNMTDLQQDVEPEQWYDVFPYYFRETEDEQLYIDLETAKAGKSTIVINPDVAIKRTYILDLSNEFEDIPTDKDFIEKAEEFADKLKDEISNTTPSITVSFVNLSDTVNYEDSSYNMEIHLCDTVHILYTRGKTQYVEATAQCVSTTYDVLSGRYTSIQLGEARSSVSSMIASQGGDTDDRINEALSGARDYYNEAIKRQTDIITGNRGGYVILQDSDGDGYPDRILVMDNLDAGKAKNVWQWNKQGLGYSSTGINGPYTLGMNMKGEILGDLLAANSVEANKVLTGYIGNENQGNYWNLVTGEFRLSALSGSTVGGQPIASTDDVANAQTAAQVYVDEHIKDFLIGPFVEYSEHIIDQLDKKAETWYQDNDPSLQWNTDNDKKEHISDLWYCTDANKSKYYQKSWVWSYNDANKTYSWVELTSTPPDAVYDHLDHKAYIFVTADDPTPPYHVGDLWFKDTQSDIFTCIEEKREGELFESNDWVARNKYISLVDADKAADDKVKDFIENQYSTDLNKVHDQIDKKAETWYQAADPSLQWKTDNDKKEHISDLWYCIDPASSYYQKYWRWNGTKWQYMQTVPDGVMNTIDGKAQIFMETPKVPYNKGDLWCTGTDEENSGDILVANHSRSKNEAFDPNDWVKQNKYIDLSQADTLLQDFINGPYAEAIKNIQNQVDGKAETWYQAADPSLQWKTDTQRKEHVGDIWYCTDPTKVKYYQKSWRWETDYTWQELKTVPDAVLDKNDGKATIFLKEPEPPYQVGDLWFKTQSGSLATDENSTDIYTCVVERKSGAYNLVTDWKKLNKYIDQVAADSAANTAANIAVNSQTQEDIFNRLTGYGKAKGLILTELGELYLSFTYAQGGTLKLGGVNNNLGTMQVLSTTNEVRAELTADHIEYRGYLEQDIGPWRNYYARRCVRVSEGGLELLVREEKDTDGNDLPQPIYTNIGHLYQSSFDNLELEHLVYDRLPYAETAENSGMIFRVRNVYKTPDSEIIDHQGYINLRYQWMRNYFYSNMSIDILYVPMIGLSPDKSPLQNDVIAPPKKGKGIYIGAWHYNYAKDPFTDGEEYGGIRIAHSGSDSRASGIYISAPLYTESGATKSKLFESESYHRRAMYCYEMANPYFGDVGCGQTDEDGICYVYLDEVFQDAINTACMYQVFLQKEGPGDIWVESKSFDSFIVKGTPNLNFSWEIKAKQKNFEMTRMEVVPEDGVYEQETIEEPNYFNEANEYVREFISNQVIFGEKEKTT